MIEDCDPLSSILDESHLSLNHLSHHSDKRGMIIRAARADQIHSQISGELFRFNVEIVKYFDVVADKADGRDDDSFVAICGAVSDCLANIRL